MIPLTFYIVCNVDKIITGLSYGGNTSSTY